jgi:hypothetical protein
MEDLADVATDLVTYLGFHIDGVHQATAPQAIAVAADSACAYYQGVGICELLLDAEVDAFFHHMIRSARARLWLLRRAQGQAGFPEKILKPGNTRGLWGAILSKEWGLARDIAELSSRRWNPKVEYEEDFRYADFVHRVVAGDSIDVQRGLLDHYARALEGDEPPRLRLGRGLVSGDAGGAADAFSDLIDDRRRELEEIETKTLMGTDELFAPLSAIYVEGLAWLRLLERAGIPTASDYAYCPSLARVAQFAAYTPTAGFPG